MFADILFPLAMLCLLAFGAVTDYRHRIIPNRVCIAVFFTGLLSMVFLPHDNIFFVPLWLRIAGVFPAILMLFIAYHKQGIGGGDIKLMIGLGFAIGYYALVPVLFITAIAAVLWAKIRKEKSVPLGFFLFIGTLIFCAINLYSVSY